VLRSLPLFPLNTALVPGLVMPLHIFEPRYRAMVEELLAEPDPGARVFAMVAVRDGHSVEHEGIGALHPVGVTTLLRDADRHADGRFDIVTVGQQRFRLNAIDTSAPLIRADLELLDEPEVEVDPVLAERVARAFAAYRQVLSLDLDDHAGLASGVRQDPSAASFLITASMVLPSAERQVLLEAPDADRRLRLAERVLVREHTLITSLSAIPALDPILTTASVN
jgi:Lon protease-like protein